MTTSVWFMCVGAVIFVVYLVTGIIQIVATSLQELKTTDLAPSNDEEDFVNRVVQQVTASPSLKGYGDCGRLGKWVFLLGLIGYLSPGGWLTAFMLVGARLFAVSMCVLGPHLDRVSRAMKGANPKRLTQDSMYRVTIWNAVPMSVIAQYALLLLIVGAFFFLLGFVGCVFF